MKEDRNLLQRFRIKSVFTQNFIGLLIILNCLSMVCCIIISSFVISETTENLNHMRTNELEQVVAEVDDVLSYVEKSLVKFTSLEDVVRGTIFPSKDALERNSSIITALKNEAAMNSGIESLSLYAAVDNKIFSNENGFQELEQYADHGVIEQHLMNRNIKFVLGTSYWITTQMVEGQLYMFCDFFYSLDHPIGTLTAKINMNLIQEALQSIKEEGTYVYILSKEGNQIQVQNNGYEAGSYKMEQITASSLYNGWRYYYSYKTEAFVSILLSILHVVFPILLIFLILSLGISFCGARVSSGPVHRLLELVGYDQKREYPSRNHHVQNEYQILDSYYRSSRQEQLQMKSLIEEYSPKIMESFFHGILDGRVYSEAEIEHVINCTDNRWGKFGIYQTIVFTLAQENGQNLTALQEEVILNKWKNTLKEQMEKTKGGLCIFLFQKRFVLITCFGGERETDWKSDLKKVEHRIWEDAQYHRLMLLISGSYECGHVKDIRYSYQEAVKNLEYQNYYLASLDVQEKQDEAGKIQERRSDHPAKRFGQMQGEIEAAQMDAARDLGCRMLEDIANEFENMDHLREAYKYFTEELIRILISYNINPQGEFMRGKIAYKDLWQLESKQEMNDYMKDYLDLALDELERQSSKRLHKAVLKTKEIIEETYSDSNLSLVMIAEKIRINSSYLSTLFIQSQHVSLTDYINAYRVEKAKQLLDSTNISAKEVGYQVGFNTAQNFNRVFKRYAGITPGQYKKR